MQSVSSRIWTCVAVSISYDDNHYTTGTSVDLLMIDIWIYDMLEIIIAYIHFILHLFLSFS